MQPAGHKSDIMGKDPIWRLLYKFSGPAIVSHMVSASYNIVDTIFVGRLGTTPLAAVSLSYPIMMLFWAIQTGTSVGAASLISRKLGEGKHEEASKVTCITTTLALIIGALTVIICLPNINGLLRLFGATDAILPLARTYLSYLIIFAFIESYFMMMGSIIRAEGSPLFVSIVFVLSALTNIILDPILIFGWGGIAPMGVAGAAIATVISRGVGALCFIIYFASGKSSFKFRASYFIPKFYILKEIYRVGVASILRMGGWSVMLIFVNRVAISYGVTTLAVFGVLSRANSLASMPCFGISQGMMPLVGYNFGARKMDRVGEVVVKAGKAIFIWGFFCTVVVMIFPAQILSLFNNEPQFIQHGITASRIFSLGYALMGLQFNFSYFFQAIGRGVASTIVGLSREFIFILPCIYIFSALLGEPGIWISFVIADVLSVSLAGVLFLKEAKRSGIYFHFRYPKSQPVSDEPAI